MVDTLWTTNAPEGVMHNFYHRIGVFYEAYRQLAIFHIIVHLLMEGIHRKYKLWFPKHMWVEFQGLKPTVRLKIAAKAYL